MSHISQRIMIGLFAVQLYVRTDPDENIKLDKEKSTKKRLAEQLQW